MHFCSNYHTCMTKNTIKYENLKSIILFIWIYGILNNKFKILYFINKYYMLYYWVLRRKNKRNDSILFSYCKWIENEISMCLMVINVRYMTNDMLLLNRMWHK